MLKAAYVQGMLTKDELDARIGQAFASRTYADLDALTADLPPGTAAARPTSRPAPVRRRPLARAAAGSGGCLVIAFTAMWAGAALDSDGTGPSPYHSWANLFFFLAVAAVVTAFSVLATGVAASLEQRRSRGRLPPRPGPGGHALDPGRRGGTSHDPIPPGPGQARADLRAHKPPQRIPARAARTPPGVRPTRGAPVPRAT